MKQLFSKKRGFSLIELLVIISISIIITIVTYFSFSKYFSFQSLDKNADVAQSYIEKARLQAVNSKNFSNYGIKFASSSVTLFTGTTYSSTATSNQKYSFASQVQLSSIYLTGNVSELYFKNVTGEPSATGTITFKVSNATSTKTITIYGTGLSEVK